MRSSCDTDPISASRICSVSARRRASLMARSAVSACCLTVCASRLATTPTRMNTPNRTICSQSSARNTGCVAFENSALISATLADRGEQARPQAPADRRDQHRNEIDADDALDVEQPEQQPDQQRGERHQHRARPQSRAPARLAASARAGRGPGSSSRACGDLRA